MQTVKRPSGLWLALELVPGDLKLVGVFDSFDLAETACAGLAHFIIANVEPGKSYRGKTVDWHARVKASKP